MEKPSDEPITGPGHAPPGQPGHAPPGHEQPDLAHVLTDELAADLNRLAIDQLDFARERIAQYAKAESPSGDLRALAACAELIAGGHAEAGGRVERVPGPMGEHLVTTWGPAHGPHLLLIGHYDTVWPVGRLADMPYTDDGERITGPGVFDMKGGLVVIEAAFRVLARLWRPPVRQVRLVVVADEEVGSPDGRRYVEQHVPGAVAALGFESPHPGGVLKTGRRGSSRIRVRVTGREAHAAIDPGKGVSAIDELLDQLASVRSLIPDDGSTLVNIGTIRGGTRSNVVAGLAEAEIGLRFTDLDVERAVLDRLLHLAPVRDKALVAVELLSNRPAWAAPEPNPLLDLVAAAGVRLGQSVTGRAAPGAGDTNLTGAAGVPTLDGFGPLGRGAHAADESIIISSIPERIALLAALLLHPYL